MEQTNSLFELNESSYISYNWRDYQIWYYQSPPAQVDFEIPSIIILHGLNFFSDFLAPMVHQYEKLHHLVICPDLLGHGRSSGSATYLQQDFVSSVYDLIKHLNLSSFRLIGHSLGGLICLKIASLYKELPIDNIVLFAPGGLSTNFNSISKFFKSVLGKVFLSSKFLVQHHFCKIIDSSWRPIVNNKFSQLIVGNMEKFKSRMLWISENENFEDLTMEELHNISVDVTTFLAKNDSIVAFDKVTAILLKLCWKFIVINDGHNFVYNFWDQIDQLK